MGRELRASALALVALTLCLGLAYPLLTTVVSQSFFGSEADGSLVEADGRTIGSELIGQDFSGDDSYFQSRPSATGYAGDVTYFGNLGPNSRRLSRQLRRSVAAYLKRERPHAPGLTAASIPPDAVMSSASGVDPQISIANARIQAHRVAAVRGMPLERVEALIDEETTGRALGFLGEPAVDVLRLNLALDAAGEEGR
jgi:K+-transporting ATPase ATPase C chain